MARHLFPGTLVFAGSNAVTLAPNLTFKVYTDLFTGTEVTSQLLGPDGVSAYSPVTDSQGNLQPFRGPDNYSGSLYADTGATTRYMLVSPTLIDSLVDQVADLIAGGAVGGSGAGGISTSALESYLATTNTPYEIFATSGGVGTYPPRPATLRPVHFYGANPPTVDGSTSGGGGMVANKDQWFQWAAQ